MHQFPKLYSKSSSGALREWTMEVEGNGYRTIHGQIGGKLVTTKWFTAEATNVGRSNERNPEAQAMFEAEAVWKKKQEKDYFQNIEDVDKVNFFEPMTAQMWKLRKEKTPFPVFSQPKLDGFRATITRHGAISRGGKPWLTIPHILKALEPIFSVYPDLILDGELYTHEFHDDFDMLSKIIKRTKPSQKDIDLSAEKIQFWCYDGTILEDNVGFTERSYFLHHSVQIGNPVVIVPTILCENEEALDEAYAGYLEDGFEGQMIRVPDSLYVSKRSVGLLKRKEHYDEEYQILEVCEGNGNREGIAGWMWLNHPEAPNGKFKSNIKGTWSFLKELLEKKDELVGQWATCRYENLTPKGVPRFPRVIRLRAGRGVDQ